MNEPTAFDAHTRFDVAGRSVLIVGAAHGLGLAIATAFAAAGARVALVDVDKPALDAARGQVATTGAEAIASVADVRDERQVAAAVRATAEAFGGIDVVVNDAAIYPTAPLAEMPTEELLRVLDVNVAGSHRVVRAAHPHLVASRAGRVINFASITFFLGFPAGLGAYISSKGAVFGLTRALARELGPAGITVNAIAPGAFPTRAEAIIEDRAAFERLILDNQCLKRRGDVGDIAAATLFLASDAASFITGQTLVVDGGWVFD